ncbi:nesp009 [Neophasia sp. alphabaculovirus]|nr:nesp009 [Neophasia sp. alphabaculovirus]
MNIIVMQKSSVLPQTLYTHTNSMFRRLFNLNSLHCRIRSQYTTTH